MVMSGGRSPFQRAQRGLSTERRAKRRDTHRSPKVSFNPQRQTGVPTPCGRNPGFPHSLPVTEGVKGIDQAATLSCGCLIPCQ